MNKNNKILRHLNPGIPAWRVLEYLRDLELAGNFWNIFTRKEVQTCIR